jgi:hypothetical protein
MMARRFTAEHRANASVPALRFDATTPDTPLIYRLLETSGTSPSSSSATSAPMLPKLMDPSASSATAGPSSGAKRRGRPPGSGLKKLIDDGEKHLAPSRHTESAG